MNSASQDDESSFAGRPRYSIYVIGIISGIAFGFGRHCFEDGMIDEALSVAAVAAAACLVIWWFFGILTRVRMTADSLVIKNGRRENEIPFEHLAGYSAFWSASNQHNVTQVTLKFRESDATAPYELDIAETVGTARYRELGAFQNKVARIVAVNMLRILKQHGEVAWTPKVTLRSDTFHIHGRWTREPEILKYVDIRDVDVSRRGELQLHLADGSRRDVSLKIDAENFYPGLIVFEGLFDRRRVVEDAQSGASVVQA